jgi:single-strand DNA-binding protein
MSFEITGKLYKKFATESKSEKFQTREFVIEIADGNYPQLVKFQLVQERCQILDNYNEGEEIKVHFDLRGREWQGKFFTSLNSWRIEKPDSESGGSTQPVQKVAKQSAAVAADDAFPTLSDEPFKSAADDDLPF